MTCRRSKPRFLYSANASHSFSVKGASGICRVTRLWRPPRERNILFTIHVVAEPQMTRRTSLRDVAHSFQKCSNAFRKPEQGVSNHGSSSRKTTFLPVDNPSSIVSSSANAEIHDDSRGHLGWPCLFNASRNAASCIFREPSSIPAA